jgi:hypothetical protein
MNKKILSISILVTNLILPARALAAVEEITLGSNQPGGVKTATPVGNILSNVLTIMFIIGGLALVVYFIWGALDWILAGGDKEKISAARKKITQGLVGLTLLALSFFIIYLFGEVIGFNPLKTIPIPKLDDAPTAPATR